MLPPSNNFPKLVYVGDVPVSSTSGGMLLLYRLLENYPARRLMVFETLVSSVNARLQDVEYHQFSKILARLRRTRYHCLFGTLALAAAKIEARSVAKILKGRDVDAIISVTHGTSWLVADRVASELGVPLFLINHDYWFDTCPTLGLSQGLLHEIFGQVYRRAQYRFCVSPEMEDHYRQTYGTAGSVLYPYRGVNSLWTRASEVPKSRPFTVAYAGTVPHDGYRDALRALARSLAAIDGVLLLYSNLSADEAAEIGAPSGNVSLRGFVPNNEVVDRLRNDSDAVFLAMTSTMGMNVRLSFPSKLADYTATGLPIIIWAPTNSSAYSWAMNNPMAAIAIPEGDETMLESCIVRLSSDNALRNRMGRASFLAGLKYFDGRKALENFVETINTFQSLDRACK